jgi:sugar phosphate isomerase/epimerase
MAKRIPIGLQLWSVRDDCKNDLPGTLKAVAEMGYQGVELAGTYDRTGEQWAQMLKANKLVASSAHLGIGAIQPAALDATMALYGAMGCKRLIVPGLPGEYTATLDGFRRACDEINAAAQKGAAQGFLFGFHNHSGEFKPVEGQIPYDVMAARLAPNTILQMDMGWVYNAKVDGAALVRKYPGREQLVHIKACSAKSETAVVGEDDVPWMDVFAACESVGKTEWYVVEHERYANPPMVCVKQCLDNLRKMGK